MGNECCSHPAQHMRLDEIQIDAIIYEGEAGEDPASSNMTKKGRNIINENIKDSNTQIDPEISRPYIGDIYKHYGRKTAPPIVHYNGSRESKHKMIYEINPYYNIPKDQQYQRSKTLNHLNDVSSLKSDLVHSEVQRIVLSSFKSSQNGDSQNPEDQGNLTKTESKLKTNPQNFCQFPTNPINSKIEIDLGDANE